ncbi:MAG: hypothetical protein JOZ99_15635 [Actinobacteria bacterium]|nr:hypothetical protein [Actinomycetota bacterium]
MTRWQRSLEIAKASWAVLKSDRQLIWLPVLSFLATLVVAGVIAGLVFLTRTHDASGHTQIGAAGYVVAIVGYFAVAFVGVYFLGALVAAADEVLRGGHPAVGAALQAANQRIHRLLPWAIVTATVTLILNALERRGGWVGRIVGSLLGLAWSVLTFLTVPIIMLENVGPGDALKRSRDLFKKTWGENLMLNFGLGALGFLAMLPAFAIVAIGAATRVTAIIVVTVAIAVAWFAVAQAVIAALSGIFRAALYRYAADGVVPVPFQGTPLPQAFAPRPAQEGGGGGRGFGGFGGFGGPGGFSGGGMR